MLPRNQNLKNILLIENDPETSAQIINWTSEYANFVRASNQTDILVMIKTQHWDLIMTDSPFTDLSDLDITKMVKTIDSLTPVLIITEDKKVNYIITALENHADGFLFKPLKKESFVSLVLKLIEDSQLKRSKQAKIILAIGAHPDDVEIGCGGSLARYYSKGDSIHILTLSYGESGGNPAIRKKEAEKAAEIQGATLHFAKCDDTNISDGVATIKIIEEIVQDISPTHIFTHSLHDNHNDHRSAYKATISACREISNIYCYQSPSSTIHFMPNIFIDISGDFIEKKLRVIANFKSQCKIRPYLQEDIIRATARYWGRFSNYVLVEPMETIKGVIL